MSDEVKKNLRTQGKYSNNKPNHKKSDKQLKQSPGGRELPENESRKRNSNGSKQNTSYDGSESRSSVKYRDNSSHSFSELEEDKKPIEINYRGEHIISETINGKSIVIYEPEFLEEADASYYFYALDDSTQWNKKNIIRGQGYAQPRLVAWYGPLPYTYSGVTLEPNEMPENVLRIKRSIEDFLLATCKIYVTFNSVLLNCYRDGRDSVSWHSDDVLSMEVCPTIASVSLGEVRKFEMRRKLESYEEEIDDGQIDRFYVPLRHGSLLVMNGSMQQDWQHRIPKEYYKRKRINLTFRTVYPLDNIPPEIPTKEYKNSQISNKAWNTSSSCEISYDEKDFPPVGHSVAISDVKHFPPLGHSVADSDEKNFSRLGHSIATTSRLDIKRETSDHDIDFESKDASLPNNTSMNSTYSNIESSMSSNFESSIVLCTTSEGDNSTESFGDNSQIRDTYISSNMNNLNDDKQNFKHKLNKNIHTSPLNSSDSMNSDEENVVHDKSFTNSSSEYKPQKSPVTSSYENFRSIAPFVSQNVNSNLNINAKIFLPSCVSSPVSEEPIEDDMSLKDFLDYNYDIMEEADLYDYSNELKKKILEEIGEFGSVKDDLSVLCDLMEDKLPLRCQKKVTAKMYDIVKRHYKRVQNNMFNTNTFRHTQQENQECASSSQGRGYQDKRNAMGRQESSNRRNSNKGNFNREEEYAERSDFDRGYSENRRESSERGNSNRGDNSNRGHLNREEYSREIGRGRRFPSNRGREDSHRGSEYRNRRIEYEN